MNRLTGNAIFEKSGVENKELTKVRKRKNAFRAIKEADKGKGKITIELGNDDPYFNQLIFKDTAQGIPKEFLPKIFDQFETKTLSDIGTGLGLSFCKMVMQAYGGDITCDSKHGKYTKFVLSFPKIIG